MPMRAGDRQSGAPHSGKTGLAGRVPRAVQMSILCGGGALIGALLAAVPATSQAPPGLARANDPAAQRALELFTRVLRRVRDTHVNRPEEPQLIEAAIQAMLGSLDGRSTWMEIGRAHV